MNAVGPSYYCNYKKGKSALDRFNTRAASGRQTLDGPLTTIPGGGLASTTVVIRDGAPNWGLLIVYVQPLLLTL